MKRNDKVMANVHDSEGNLLSKLSWPYPTFNWSKDFQIVSVYQDEDGNIHESISYYSRPTDGSWKVNSSYDIDSYESLNS